MSECLRKLYQTIAYWNDTKDYSYKALHLTYNRWFQWVVQLLYTSKSHPEPIHLETNYSEAHKYIYYSMPRRLYSIDMYHAGT